MLATATSNTAFTIAIRGTVGTCLVLSVLIGDQDCHISIHWTGGGYFSQLRCKLRFGEITSFITA